MRPLTLAAGLTLALTMALPTGVPASAVPPPGLADLPAVVPVLSCADVPGLRLDGVTISSATVVSAGAPAGQDPTTCLTAAEAAVVRRLHDGATDARGRRLEVAVAHEWGSELEWTLFVPAAPGQTVASEMFALSYLRYLAEPNHPGPDYQLTDLAFTVESFWRTVLPSSTYLAALDPDLRAFRRGGGAGPNTFDVLTPVMAWVESGRQPGRITAANVVNGAATRTRPVLPYPAVARYDGTGSVDDAATFVAVTPRRPVRIDTSWAGQGLYSSGYQTWPQVAGGKLVFPPARR